MSKDTLPFSDKTYSKLSFRCFPTLRRTDKYGSVGDVNIIAKGSKGNRDELGKAKIVAKETRTLDDLPEAFLLHDTESDNWDEAYDSLNGFYDEVIGQYEELTLYWSVWTEKYE